MRGRTVTRLNVRIFLLNVYSKPTEVSELLIKVVGKIIMINSKIKLINKIFFNHSGVPKIPWDTLTASQILTISSQQTIGNKNIYGV